MFEFHAIEAWPAMSLKKIHAFGSEFDIYITKEKDKIHVVINDLQKKAVLDKSVREGESLEVKL